MKPQYPHSKSKRAVSRRDFLRMLKFLGLEAILLAVGSGIYMREFEPSWVEVTKITLKLPHLGRSFSGLRMVQISDLHFGGWLTTEHLVDIVQMIIDQSPDFVTITGDYILGYNRVPNILEKIDEMASILKPLSEKTLTFGILGNHDYWINRDVLLDTLQLAGIRDLNNAVHTFEHNGEMLHIAGVDDVMKHRDRMDQVLMQLPEEGCAILLAHEPDFADISAATGRFDLQLSGHSHGGQVVLPIIGPPFLPSLAQKYPSGLYQVEKMFQYTNRGLGMAQPYVRFNCRPEITVFTLEST